VDRAGTLVVHSALSPGQPEAAGYADITMCGYLSPDSEQCRLSTLSFAGSNPPILQEEPGVFGERYYLGEWTLKRM
jgi:hypothetical protein